VVTEQCVRPACEHRRHPSPEAGYLRVTDGVDADVNPMQPPDLHPMLDRATAEAQLQELAMGDDPVLTSCHRSDITIAWATYSPYIGPYVAHTGHAGEDGDRRRAEGMQT
jgi:hypothetical protein